MLARIHFEFDRLLLPVHNNHILQAVIMKWLSDENYVKFVHDIGYKYGKRSYKLFSFSSLYGKNTYDETTKNVTFMSNAYIYLSCVDSAFLEHILNTIIKNSEFELKKQKVYVTKFEILTPTKDSTVVVKTASPVTIYSTYESGGRKLTKFYSPDDEEFIFQIVENMKRKLASYGDSVENETIFKFDIHHVGRNPKKVVVNYKGAYITSWKTLFKISGKPEVIDFILGAGLGSKNSCGFGCVVPVEQFNES
ncbi:MAG: CRISPR-associated endoribonuclease Cas6 [Fervidobacterium sp.]|uniref:CRISPR-associated endoribonuclease Cas6 n=1 Tax=Fervidobacterium sp. TaxID=1871331 RepID=UPI004049F431